MEKKLILNEFFNLLLLFLSYQQIRPERLPLLPPPTPPCLKWKLASSLFTKITITGL